MNKSEKRFISWLQETLIPDLTESGYVYTAKDLRDVVKIALSVDKTAKSSLTVKQSQFIDYLEDTLIPDLYESGNDPTAEGFEAVIAIIRYNLARYDPAENLARAGKKSQRAKGAASERGFDRNEDVMVWTNGPKHWVAVRHYKPKMGFSGWDIYRVGHGEENDQDTYTPWTHLGTFSAFNTEASWGNRQALNHVPGPLRSLIKDFKQEWPEDMR